MEKVTLKNLDSFIERYAAARGGERNEETSSEAMFIFLSKYGGAFILSTGLWIGLQNATARWSDSGNPFPSVRDALVCVLTSDWITAIGSGVFYSEDSVSRLAWIADQISKFKADGSFLLYA